MDQGYSFTQVVLTPAILLPVVCIAVLTRLYVKRCIVKVIRLDDWIMLISALYFTVQCVLVFILASRGFGKHIEFLTEDDARFVLKVYYISEINYAIIMLTIKCSIALLLYRLTLRPLVKWFIISIMAFFVLVTIAAVVITTFQCYPVEMFWDRTIDGWCMDNPLFAGLAYGYALASAGTDMSFAALPVYMVWSIRMDTKTKISIICVLSLGFLTAAVSFVRFGYINTLQKQHDNTYVLVPMVILTLLEMGLGIIAGSLATCRPLLRKFHHACRSGSLSDMSESTDTQKPPTMSKAPTQSKKHDDIDQYPHLSSALNDTELATPLSIARDDMPTSFNLTSYGFVVKAMSNIIKFERSGSGSSVSQMSPDLSRMPTQLHVLSYHDFDTSLSTEIIPTRLSPSPTPRAARWDVEANMDGFFWEQRKNSDPS